jgi:tRNA pseudouridine-54 N-methylase
MSPQAQENVEKIVSDVSAGVEILILDADGQVIQKIKVGEDQSFIVKPIKANGIKAE